MATLTITHTHEDGTILTGSEPNDGVYEIVRKRGFTWRAQPGIFIRGSRNKRPQEWKITEAADALRAAGHTVEVNIERTPQPAAVRPTAEVEEQRRQAAARRVDRLQGAAEKLNAKAKARDESADRVLDGVPLGQPMLRGHHSYSRDFNQRTKAWKQQDRAADDRRAARQYASLAEAAAANQRHHENGRVTMRRLEEIRAGIRQEEAELARTISEDRREFVLGRLAGLKDKEAHWVAHMAKLAESGEFVPWTPEHFQPTDQVRIEGTSRWYRVLRVNKVSLSIDGEWGRATYKWDKIAGRRRDGVQLDAPNDKPWPVELAKKVDLWQHLQTPAGRGISTEQAMRAGWAQRIAHGLPSDAADAEVAAFGMNELEEDEARAVIAFYVDIYRRLAAGEEPAAVRASVIPLPYEAQWRVPDREPQDRLAAPGGYNNPNPHVQVGDLIVGTYDIGSDRRLDRRSTGPVVAISDVRDRRERGEWVTITLADGRELEVKTHRWFAVHPAGTWEKTAEAKAVEVASLTVEHARQDLREAVASCDTGRIEAAQQAVADADDDLAQTLQDLPRVADADSGKPDEAERELPPFPFPTTRVLPPADEDDPWWPVLAEIDVARAS